MGGMISFLSSCRFVKETYSVFVSVEADILQTASLLAYSVKGLAALKVTQGIRDISAHGSADAVNNFLIIFLHALFDPVQHQPDKAVLIEIGHKLLLLLCNVHPCGFFFYNTFDQIVGQVKKVAFDLIPAQCMVNI